MKTAKLNDELISLQRLPREEFQRIYESSLKESVTCVACEQPLKMYFGLTKSPFFYHSNKLLTSTCQEKVEKIELQLEEQSISHSPNEDLYSEQNGFRIPKARSIATADKPITTTAWKLPKELKTVSPFTPIEKKTSSLVGIDLDTEQQIAVTTTEGPLLILAGAGSGKTRVLTTRALYMIEEKKIDPKSIMLVTFTAKAAREMQERLKKRSNGSYQALNQLVIGTFHSIFYKILQHHDKEKWNGQRLIKWDWQKENYIKQACRELAIDEKDFPFDQAIQQIGLWKNTMKSPNQVIPVDDWERKVLPLYQAYEQKKEESGQFDFDDMLLKCYELLKTNHTLLKAYQTRFHYFLIDEFQDINPVQYKLMKLLSSHTHHLCGVGDDDQTIYSFRGSEPSFILNFKTEYPAAKIIHLSANYRSDHHIVSTANDVISKNKTRHPKKMTAQSDSHAFPLSFFPYDEEEEATLIVNDIREKIEMGANPNEFAILYRTHTGGRAILERFIQSSLPFTFEKGQNSFYERRMVRTALAYLRLSVDPDNTDAFTDLIRALFLKQSILNDVKAMSILHDCSLLESLLHVTGIASFQMAKIKKIIPRIHSLKTEKPMMALAVIEKDLGFNDYVKKQGNEGNAMEKGSDDLNDLKVVAKKFLTVHDFLEHTDHMLRTQKALKTDSRESGVQLMTIHRSKGLEFEHVYILGAVDGSLPHDFSLEAWRKGNGNHLEEERRLLYVAMTRAKQFLAISSPAYRRGRKAVTSRFLKPLM
ncbi:ATP-dependent helicase [Metabacillus sp. HB246100]